MDMEESTARATATAGGAVAFAGTTVVIALCSLVAAGIPLVSTMGYTAAVAVAVAVVAAITLLPAMLGALGPRINSLRVHLGRTHPDDHEPHGWRRWAGGVARRPWASMVAGVAVLVVLAVPALNLHLGQNDVGAMSKDTTARQAYDLISEGFGPGQNGPLLVAVQAREPRQERPEEARRLQQAGTGAAGPAAATGPAGHPAGDRAGPLARRGTGPGRAEGPAEQVRPAEAGGPEEAARVAGQRPAAADAAERHRQDLRRQVRVPAGGGQEGRRGDPHGDRHHGAVLATRPRTSWTTCATT